MQFERDENGKVLHIDEMRTAAIAWGDRLHELIFQRVPPECIMKLQNCIGVNMLALNLRMLRLRLFGKPLIGREDVCLLCTVAACRWNSKVSHPFLRALKVRLLGFVLRDSFGSLLLDNNHNGDPPE